MAELGKVLVELNKLWDQNIQMAEHGMCSGPANPEANLWVGRAGARPLGVSAPPRGRARKRAQLACIAQRAKPERLQQCARTGAQTFACAGWPNGRATMRGTAQQGSGQAPTRPTALISSSGALATIFPCQNWPVAFLSLFGFVRPCKPLMWSPMDT